MEHSFFEEDRPGGKAAEVLREDQGDGRWAHRKAEEGGLTDANEDHVAEFSAFYNDESVWVNEAWYDDAHVTVDGVSNAELDIDWSKPIEKNDRHGGRLGAQGQALRAQDLPQEHRREGRVMQRDPFEPRHEPARSIYLAFQREAEGRKGRTPEQWQEAEITAVYAEANRQSDLLDLRPVSREQVERAEICARGSVDYGLAWTLAVVREMQPRS